MGSAIGGLFGGQSKTERTLGRISTGGVESRRIQEFLPTSLRAGNVNPFLSSGIQGIGELIRNPGGLSPSVSEAILPRLSAESETIALSFRGLGSQQAGAAARGNVPTSIKTALQSALDVAQERAQRGARREALSESETLRREDLGRTMSILDAILQFISSGKGQAIQGLGALVGSEASGEAAQLQLLGTLASAWGAIAAAGAGVGGAAAGAGGGAAVAGAAASASRFKHSILEVSNEHILDAINALPVYEWSYKGEGVRHVGPMAEDFRQAFGLGDSPDQIYYIDAIGTLMAATQALAKKINRLEAR